MQGAVGLARLEHILGIDAGVLGDLGCGGRGAGRPGELLTHPLDAHGELLEVARHAQRPAVVAEVALDRADDARYRVGREGGLAAGVEAVDRLDEREACHLLEVLERLGAASVTAGQAAREREVAFDQQVACTRVVGVVIGEEESLVLSALCAQRVLHSSKASTARIRSGPAGGWGVFDVTRGAGADSDDPPNGRHTRSVAPTKRATASAGAPTTWTSPLAGLCVGGIGPLWIWRGDRWVAAVRAPDLLTAARTRAHVGQLVARSSAASDG